MLLLYQPRDTPTGTTVNNTEPMRTRNVTVPRTNPMNLAASPKPMVTNSRGVSWTSLFLKHPTWSAPQSRPQFRGHIPCILNLASHVQQKLQTDLPRLSILCKAARNLARSLQPRTIHSLSRIDQHPRWNLGRPVVQRPHRPRILLASYETVIRSTSITASIPHLHVDLDLTTKATNESSLQYLKSLESHAIPVVLQTRYHGLCPERPTARSTRTLPTLQAQTRGRTTVSHLRLARHLDLVFSQMLNRKRQ